MAVPRSALLAAVALLVGPAVQPSTAEATTSSVFTLLAQLQQQQQARRQATRTGGLALLQRSEPANGQTTERTFHGLDTNSDGLLSRDEIATFAASQGLDEASAKSELALLDTDGDGALNMSEFVGVLGSPDATDAAADAAALPQQAAAPAPAVAARQAAPTAQAATTAQAAVQQVSQAPAALSDLATLEGPATLAAASPVALPALAVEQTTSAAAASASVASSSDFVSMRAKQLLASWNKFESDAKHAEAEAATLRAKAREELREAQELTAIADYAMARAKQASVHQAGDEAATAGVAAGAA